MRVKREKREKGLESSPEYADYPKTAIEVAVVAAVEGVAKRGTAVKRIEAPGTAPQRRTIIIPIFYPDTAIRRRILLVIVPSIGTPFPDISVHIIESESVGGKFTNGGGFLTINTFRTVSINIIAVVVG